jgi:ATP-binding cassette subfamily B protein/subfamily B ATP-binding cassette protein MsbA
MTSTRFTRYSDFIPYLRRQAAGIAVILLLNALCALAAALQPWPLKILVDYGVKQIPAPNWLPALTQSLALAEGPQGFILIAAAATIGLFALSTTFNAAQNWAWAIVGRRMMSDLSADLFHKLQRRSLLRHGRSSIGDSLSRLSSDTWCLQIMTAGLVTGPATNVLSLVTLGYAGWRLDPEIGILSLMLAPLLAASSLSFGPRLKRHARRGRESQARLMSFVQQTLAAIPIVQAFSREDFNTRRFGDLADEATDVSQRRALVHSAFGFVNGLITTAGIALVLFAGGRRVLAGHLSVGGLLVFVTYMRNLQNASEGLLNMYGTLKPVEASIDRVLEILREEDAVPERRGAIRLLNPSDSGRRVSLERVSFSYDGERRIFDDVSLEAQPGQTVALVGETGAGKSTLVSLIPRFFDPTAGRVSIDGTDIRDIQLASVRQQVALVLQEPFLLPITIAENIAYGRPDASLRDIEHAARAANAQEFIERLHAGYDTVVGQRGATLSGGEQQRIAIARALLKNAPILILDEPTSALDVETEALVVDALQRLMAGRTTFIIGHRLSTVRHADEIIVLHMGTVAERGTHRQLLCAGGLYSKVCSLQTAEASTEIGA